MEFIIIPVTPFEQNCTLIWCPKSQRCAVVDPGGDIEKISSAIEKAGVEPVMILLTHAHIDHAGASAELSAAYDLPIIGPHRADKFWIDALPQQSLMFGFPAAQSFTPTRWLEDGDLVELGQEEIGVIHCPGHTPGHVVFVVPPDRLLIVGDVLFRGSIGRTDFPRGDHRTLLRSIHQKLLPLGDDFSFIPGHGPTSTLGYERKNNPFLIP